MSTTAALDQAFDDLSAGRAPDPEAGRRVAELARAHLQTDAGAAMLKRRAVQERDGLLVELARQHFAHLPSVRAQARAILTAARRYEAAGWLRERHAIVCPPHRIGTPQGAVWAVLTVWPDLPSGTALRELLSNTVA